ncbi:hypothetical protein BDY19DRAFT_1060990 [Irpex rosettiformis]|uniref:Uncharacterized protein n=1 Tax=Irpex rosettiformis TaxID=378272 RepID=A0ACB8TMV1_9APHY|nr:hypothetical protein BDY19DRAFT_1060990 [Irpex rosettiformis]
MALFDDVFYYLSKTILPDHRSRLGQILDLNGGTSVELNDPRLTHWISATPTAPLDNLPGGSSAHAVTPLWVERTLVLSTPQDTEFYSPDPTMLFSGVVATSCSLSSSDNEVLSAGITSLGGQWRSALTKDVTHVFALGGGSAKFETAMHFKEGTGMKVVVPHWFDNVVRLGIRGLDTDEYEWPELRVFKGEEGRKKGRGLSVEKKALYDTALGGSPVPEEGGSVWKGVKIVLGSSLELNDSQREAHKADIERGGGEVLEFATAEEELDRIGQTDVYVTRFRSGRAFVKAYRLKKTIGTLPWLWYVRATGSLSNPLHQLLHYPIPNRPIDGFAGHIITITNYTGKDREYIKKLITTMGAEFTASMSGKNTVVVAAFISGIKTTKAISWQIPVVNHLWLEDCFSQWRNLSPATSERYVAFSPAVDYGSVLTEERGLGAVVGRGYDQEELAEMEKEVEQEEEDGVIQESMPSQPRKGILKNASMQSLRSAQEVEDVVAPSVRGYGQSQDKDGVGLGDVSMGGYQDIDVPINIVDGRLSLSEDEGDVVAPRTPVKRGRGRPRKGSVGGTPASRKSAGTPGSGKSARGAARYSEDEESRPRKLVRRVGRPPSSSRQSSTKENDSDVEGRSTMALVEPGLESSARKGSVIKTYRTRSRSRSQSRPRTTPGKGKERALSINSSDEDEDEEDGENVKVGETRRGGVPSDTEGEGSGGHGVKRGRGRPRKIGRPSKVISDGEEEEGGKPPHTPKTPRKFERRVSVVLPTLKQVRSASRQRSDVDERREEEDVVEVVKEKEVVDSAPAQDAFPAKVGKKRGRPRKNSIKEPVEPEREGEDVVEVVNEEETSPTKVGKKRGRPRKNPVKEPAHHPEKEREGVVEVVNEKEETSPTKVGKKRGRPRKNPVEEPVEPIRRPEENKDKEPELMPPPQAKPTTSVKSTMKPKAKVQPPLPPPPPKTTPETSKAGPSKVVAVQETPTRTPSSRSAATKATKRLHEEVMPDVVSFQREMKNGGVKGVGEEGSGGGRGVKRGVVGEGREDGSERERKRVKMDEVETAKGQKKPTSDARSAEESDVVVMTTQVNLPDDVIKAFAKLGGKFTTKPQECTHLVARSIVRTEKFLYAMAVGAHVVSVNWVEMCVAKKTILPADGYTLKDPTNEEKFGFKLSDALKRAGEKKGKLFEGKTFYVTPKVPVDTKLMKNVITLGGGQFSTQTPTARILKGSSNRVVVSSPGDIAIWRPLLEAGFPVYSQELVLTGMLRQEVDWEGREMRVADSA